jgi:hypothetical protein
LIIVLQRANLRAAILVVLIGPIRQNAPATVSGN